MIKNDKQLQITKNKLNEFIKALDNVERQSQINPILKQIQLSALKSQIEEFEKDILEYESLKKGTLNCVYINSFENLYEVLIKARIAKGWSHSDLAKKLKLKEQQIQRYEACNYSTASIPRIFEVIDVLGIGVSPVRFKINTPNFIIPEDIDQGKIEIAQKKLSERGTLLALQ